MVVMQQNEPRLGQTHHKLKTTSKQTEAASEKAVKEKNEGKSKNSRGFGALFGNVMHFEASMQLTYIWCGLVHALAAFGAVNFP